jgi:DNA repair protein RadC
VHPREVFADAGSDRACALIIAHNHPSGRLEPSPEDMDITKRLQEAGKVMGISLLDHVIFTQNTFCSFVEKGFMVPEFD